jgi:protein TonB
MELKKSPKADLERVRNIFLMLGLVVALGLVLFAFEWSSKPTAVSSLGQVQAVQVEEEIIPITRQEEIKAPPPAAKTIEVLNIVNDDVEIKDELKIEDTEADDQTIIDVAPVIQQAKEEVAEEEQVFYTVEEMPEPPGGEIGLRNYIKANLKYPPIAQENGVQGKVYVQFVVDVDGSITNAKVPRSVDPALDKEALRVINSLPKWKPGKQRGKAVKVSYTVPINFQLQ